MTAKNPPANNRPTEEQLKALSYMLSTYFKSINMDMSKVRVEIKLKDTEQKDATATAANPSSTNNSLWTCCECVIDPSGYIPCAAPGEYWICC